MLNLISYPQIIVKQSSAPAITGASVLWRDSDDDTLYFSDGASWQQFSSASDSAGYEQMISQVMLELLRLSAEGVLTAPDYNGLYCDYFSDADGQDGTIDTGNTTATHDGVDSYGNALYVPNLTGAPVTSESAESGLSGLKILTKSAGFIKVSKSANCTATKCHIYASDHSTLLEEVAFVGDVATFTYELADATNYYLLADSDGGSYTRSYDTHSPFAIVCTSLNFVGSFDSGADNSTHVFNLIGVDLIGTPANKIVKTNAQALPFSPAYILVHAKDKTLAGTGAINYDISFDGGSTQDSTGNALDSKIAVTDGSSKNMIITINVNGVGAGNTAKLKDYGVLLWSS